MPDIRYRRIQSAFVTMQNAAAPRPPFSLAPGQDGVMLKASDNRLKIVHTAVPANNYDGPPEAKFGAMRLTWNALMRMPDGTLGWGPENMSRMSEDFSTIQWTKTDTTITVDNTLAPDGNMTADLLTEGVAGTALLQPGNGHDYKVSRYLTASRHFKRGNHDWIRFSIDGAIYGTQPVTNRVAIYVNLANGTIGNNEVLGSGVYIGSSITPVANGFYRVSLTGTVIGENYAKDTSHSATANGNPARVANGTRWEWGTQFERTGAPTYYKQNLTTAAWYGIRYETVTPIGEPGYLIEGTRTNLVPSNSSLWCSHRGTANAGNGLPMKDGENCTSTGGGSGKYQAMDSALSTFYFSGVVGNLNGTITGTVSGGTRTFASQAAVWVPVNMTALRNQTGPDGIPGFASSITATAANATILASLTVASSIRAQSAYVKRLVGSGVIEMTQDNGVTWTAIPVTGSWTRVTIPDQTLTNPVVGFRIATSGDSIAVWCVQNELAPMTSPIPVIGFNQLRNADIPKLLLAQIPINQAEGTLYARAAATVETPGLNQSWIVLDVTSGTTLNALQRNPSPSFKLTAIGYDNGVVTGNFSASADAPLFTPVNGAMGYKLNDCGISVAGGAINVDSTYAIPAAPFNVLVSGNRNAGSAPLEGYLTDLLFLTTRLSNTDLQHLSTKGIVFPAP
jgi:hypothetical protein